MRLTAKARDMIALSLALALSAAAVPAAAVDLVKGRKDLPTLVLGEEKGSDFAVSPKVIEMESGKSYRLQIKSNGGKEYAFHAPEFFRNLWLNQIVINHLEVHMNGAPDHLEFDDEGTIALEFVTIRPGTYNWSIKGFEDKGMTGQFVVK